MQLIEAHHPTQQFESLSKPHRQQHSVQQHAPPVPQTRISVVIPTLNEAKNLPYVLPFIPAKVTEVILVDGFSTDNTVAIAQKLYPNIVIIQDAQPGKGAALRRGFEACTGDYIVMIDADGSTDPREIPAYIHALENGADFVKGSRNMLFAQSHDITPFRDMGNHGLRLLVNLLYRTRFTDLCYGYIAFKRQDLEQLHLDSDGFEIETQMIVRALANRLTIVEVPSTEHPRQHGESNLHAIRDGFRILNVIIREFLKPRRQKSQRRITISQQRALVEAKIV